MTGSRGCFSCSGLAVKYVGGFITSSVVGWISGKITALAAPAAITLIGAENAREAPWLVSLPLAAIPFGISFILSLGAGLFFQRNGKAVGKPA